MGERGGAPAGFLWTAVAILVFFGLLGVACGACFNDDDHRDSLGRVELIRHDRGGDDYGNDDGGRYGNDNDNRRCRGNNCRGSFSPGPFDRSPVDIHDNCISLDCGGQDRPPPGGGTEPPAGAFTPESLFPPTPQGIRDFVLNTVKAGIELGRVFSDVTITFVENLLVGLA